MLIKEFWLSIYLLCHVFLSRISGNPVSKQSVSCFVMKFPSKEFPVMTIQFLWYFRFEEFPGTQLKMCFPQCHHIILNYISVVYPFSMIYFFKASIKSNCLLCSARLGFPLLFPLFFSQREYHSSPGKFHSLNLFFE